VDRLKKAAVLTRFVSALRERGSWGGETHIQKAAYFLQELLGVPLGFRFVLYWYGPFSFDLRDELTGLRGDELLTLNPQYPYGSSYKSTERASYVQSLFEKTLDEYRERIEFVADQLGAQGVKSLERLATGYYVTKGLPKAAVEDRALRLTKIKPHVSHEDAVAAIQMVDKMITKSKPLLH
jgi:uncharacterized protein YwgA